MLSLTKFRIVDDEKILLDINLKKFIDVHKRKRSSIKIVEFPLVKIGKYLCLWELGGYNPNRKVGISCLIGNEMGYEPTGLRFFKKNKKKNGKHAIIPIQNGYYVAIGQLNQNENNSSINFYKCTIDIYRIMEIDSREHVENGKSHVYQVAIGEHVFRYNKPVLEKSLVPPEFHNLIKSTFTKLLYKNCKVPIYVNGWELISSIDKGFIERFKNKDEIMNMEGKVKVSPYRFQETLEQHYQENILDGLPLIVVRYDRPENEDKIIVTAGVTNTTFKRLKESKDAFKIECDKTYQCIVTPTSEIPSKNKLFLQAFTYEELVKHLKSVRRISQVDDDKTTKSLIFFGYKG